MYGLGRRTQTAEVNGGISILANGCPDGCVLHQGHSWQDSEWHTYVRVYLRGWQSVPPLLHSTHGASPHGNHRVSTTDADADKIIA